MKTYEVAPLSLVILVSAAFLCDCGRANAEDKPHPFTGYVSTTTNEDFAKTAVKGAEFILAANSEFEKEGLKPLVVNIDDVCFLGFADQKPDGKYVAYQLDTAKLRQGEIYYGQSSAGACVYDATKNMDACKSSDGDSYYIKYAPNDFLRQTTFGSQEEADHNQNGSESSVRFCNAFSSVLLAHSGAEKAGSDDAQSGLGAIARAAIENSRYLEVLNRLQ